MEGRITQQHVSGSAHENVCNSVQKIILFLNVNKIVLLRTKLVLVNTGRYLLSRELSQLYIRIKKSTTHLDYTDIQCTVTDNLV